MLPDPSIKDHTQEQPHAETLSSDVEPWQFESIEADASIEPKILSIDEENGTCLFTFSYCGKEATRRVVLELPPFSRQNPEKFEMEFDGDHGIWRLDVELPLSSRFSYRFIEGIDNNGPVQDDIFSEPLAFSERSYLKRLSEMHLTIDTPGASPRFSAKLPAEAERGSISAHIVENDPLGPGRQAWLYTPPDIDDRNVADLLVFFDGEMYLRTINVPEILDALHHDGRIPKTAAVFISNLPGRREKELILDVEFAEVAAVRIPKFAASNLNVGEKDLSVYFVGASYGAVAALYVASKHPDTCRGVISQSASLWRCIDQMDELIGSPKDRHLNMQWGLYETQERNDTSLREANQLLAEKLRTSGHKFIAEEFRGGHGPTSWREALPKALEAMLRT